MIGWAGGRAWFIVYGVILTPATVTPGLGHRDNEASEKRPTIQPEIFLDEEISETVTC